MKVSFSRRLLIFISRAICGYVRGYRIVDFFILQTCNITVKHIPDLSSCNKNILKLFCLIYLCDMAFEILKKKSKINKMFP